VVNGTVLQQADRRAVGQGLTESNVARRPTWLRAEQVQSADGLRRRRMGTA
jgi:hypothetical protein